MFKVFFKSVFNGIIFTFKPTEKALMALGMGAVSVLSFEPFGAAPAFVLSLAGLFWLWTQAESRQEGFKFGFWFGLGLFGLGVSWLMSSLYGYGGVVLPLAVMGTFLFVAFLAVFIGLAGAMVRYFYDKERPGLGLMMVMPATWVLFEWLRGMMFGGFPFLLGGTSHIHTWLDGYAPLLGVLGMSWAVALTAAALVWLATQRTWLAASFSLATVWLVGAGLQKVEWVTPIGAPVQVALIQGNVSQDLKWTREAMVPTLTRYVNLTKESLGEADLIVWPETAIPDYFDRVKEGHLHRFLKDAQLLETDVLMGVIVRNLADRSYYNAIVNAHNPKQVYRKQHLVPFSEYFPFPTFFNKLSLLFDIPFSSFTHGEKNQQNMMLSGHSVGLSVCYEMAFGDEIANSVPEAKFLITVSNDAWFAHTFQPAQQLQDVQMRALELGREIARSTNTGFTAIVDIQGNIKQQIAPYKVGVLKGPIQPYEGSTFFAEWKHMPVLFLLCLIFGFLITKRFIVTGKWVR